MVNLHAHLQRHHRHHHFAGAGDKKSSHVQNVQPQAQVIVQAVLQQLGVGIGRGHGEHPCIGFETLQVEGIEGCEQLGRRRLDTDHAQPQVHFVHIHRGLDAFGVRLFLEQLVVQSRQERLRAALGYQAGTQLLILRQTQVQAQFVLEGFQRGVLLERVRRGAGHIDQQGLPVGVFHQRHAADSGVFPLQHWPP